MTTPLETLIPELEAHVAELEPPLQGFDNFEDLDKLTTPASAISRAGVEVYTAIAALTALAEHAYPDLPVFLVWPTIGEDLQRQSDAMIAALRQVRIEAVATHANVTFSAPTKKTPV